MKKFTLILIALVAATVVAQAQMAITPGRALRPIRTDPNAPNQPPPAQSGQAQPGQNQQQISTNPDGVGTPLYYTASPGFLLLKTLDTNHNSVIESFEIATASESLKTLDHSKDGRLTEEEYLYRGEPHPSFSPLVKALDLNEDSIIDAKEIAGAPAALRVLDKNFDGALTTAEYRPTAAVTTAAINAAYIKALALTNAANVTNK
jgi:hypothetical protein